MSTALVLSLLIHALLLSLDFGNQEFGLPGLSLPWRERRFEAGDLRVALVPVPTTAALPVLSEPSANLRPIGPAKPEPVDVPGALAVVTPSPSDRTEIVASPPAPAQTLIASALPDPDPATATVVTAVSPMVAAPVVATVPSDLSPAPVRPTPHDESDATQSQIDPVVRERDLEVAEPEPARVEGQQQADSIKVEPESLRLQAERQEAERQDAAHHEAARQAVARNEAAQAELQRQEAALVEAARLDAESQQAAQQALARQQAAQVEAQRQEVIRKTAVLQEAERAEAAQQAAVRQEAERQEAARVDAERQAAARQETAKQELARDVTARQEAARQETARQEEERRKAARAEQEAKREAVLRAIGRQLDEEAARRDALSSSTARRGRLFGRTDPNSELILYAEAWSRKIELNMTFDMVREAVKQRHTNPLVTVALRSDGSVESVTFVVSSGVADIDEAIRRIVQSQAPYRAFPPGLSRDYDVIEIRRSWYFDMAVRLF